MKPVTRVRDFISCSSRLLLPRVGLVDSTAKKPRCTAPRTGDLTCAETELTVYLEQTQRYSGDRMVMRVLTLSLLALYLAVAEEGTSPITLDPQAAAAETEAPPPV